MIGLIPLGSIGNVPSVPVPVVGGGVGGVSGFGSIVGSGIVKYLLVNLLSSHK